MALTNNKNVLTWVKEMEDLMTPDKTIWIDGSEGQLRDVYKRQAQRPRPGRWKEF